MRVLRIVSIAIFASLVLSIAGCINPAIKEESIKTIINSTETQDSANLATAVYSQTLWATASISPEEIIVPAPGSEEKVFIDPEGWFSVIFPGDFEPTNLENRFSKDNRYIEFGYLPDLGNVAGIDNVCAWIANIIEEDPENWIVDWYNLSDSCSIKTLEELPRQIKYQVFYNPNTDPNHRFVYVKTGWYECPVRTKFTWLNPGDHKYIQELSPINSDLLAEWENTAPILDNVTVKEYILTAGSNPYGEMLISSLPEEAKPSWARGTPTPSDHKDSIELPTENILESFGYEMKYPDGVTGYGQLFRDGRLLFDPVWKTFSYKFDTGTETIYAVEVVLEYGKDEAYLILNDAIHQWSYSHQDPGFPPIIYQGEVLWIRADKEWDHVQIINSDQEVKFSFAIYSEPMYSTRNFLIWNGHWVWVLRDFVIVDGEILNEVLGFQEIFYWRLINGKPAYFFRKDGRAGFSFDGKIYPLEYQNIAVYMCCGYSVNNPSIENNSARFFAERDGVWYYVVLDFQ